MEAGPLTTGQKHEGMFISFVEQKHTLQSFGCQKIKLFATFKYVTTQTIRVEKYIRTHRHRHFRCSFLSVY